MKPDEFTIKELMLNVGNGHNVYVHEWGNKSAVQTFLFLHGGPGSGCTDKNKAIFDGSRDRVIFFDQRGAGRSTPHGSIYANTTQLLVEDIVSILQALNLSSVVIVGISWGSCLALAFALAHPDRVSSLVIRGVFTGSLREVNYLLEGQFRDYYPDVYDTLRLQMPAEYRASPMRYLVERILHAPKREQVKAGYDFMMCIRAISSLNGPGSPIDEASFDPSGARIQAHYIRNHCFMSDHFILDRAHQIRMPVHIVQGRYDTLCPPITAYELHEQLPKSTLQLTIAGHIGDDRANFEAQRLLIQKIATHQKGAVKDRL